MANEQFQSHGGGNAPKGFLIALGEYDNIKPGDKFGFNAAVGTSEETIWTQGGAYAYLGAATTLKISSSSTNDDDGGSGATLINIQGLDANYNAISENVIMDGRTEVDTANQYLRIYRAVVIDGAVNDGDIYAGTGTVTDGVPAVVYLKMDAGEAQTLMALRTVPADHKLILWNYQLSSATAGTQTLTVRLRARPFGQVFQTKDKFIISNTGGAFTRSHKRGQVYGPKTDIEFGAMRTGGSDAEISCFWEFDLVKFK